MGIEIRVEDLNKLGLWLRRKMVESHRHCDYKV